MVCTRQSRRRRLGQRYFLTFQLKQRHSLPCYNQAFYFSSYLMRQTQGMHEVTRPFFTVALHIPTPSTTRLHISLRVGLNGDRPNRYPR